MPVRDNQRTNLPHLPSPGVLGAGFATLIFCACIPSYPPCDCSKADDESGGGPGEFPDFDFLDRSQPCAEDVPLPIEGAECGYPEGPYGFDDGDVMGNLKLFDCTGMPVQLAQYIPQVGLPDVETRGVVFGVGAAWCQPCAEEAAEWSAEGGPVDLYAPQGIQFLQALDEGGVGPATAEACAGWSTANAKDKFPIVFTPDQGSLQSTISGQSGAPIPYTLIFNANANIVLKHTGGILDADQLTAQLDLLLDNPYGN